MEGGRSPGGEHFRDRGRWLIAVGLIEILMGAFCGLCGLLFWLFTPFFRQNPATADIARGGMLAVNVLAIFAAAVLFVVLGVGTMRARRWARDLMLVAAWVWLIVGACALVLVFTVLPGRLQGMSGQVPLGGAEIAAIMALVIVFTGFLYVVLPGLFVLFYSGRNVRKTFENRDPDAGWTGKCPLSVLSLCQLLACAAITSAVSAFYADALPIGGRVVTGVPVKLILVAFTALYCYLTWAAYKLKAHAWWINFLFTILCFAWFLGNYTESGLAELASNFGLSVRVDGQILSPSLWSGRMLWGFLATSGAGYVVFLLMIRKHFKGKARSAPKGEK